MTPFFRRARFSVFALATMMALIMALAAGAGASAQAGDYYAELDWRSAVKASVREALKDPDSAQFKLPAWRGDATAYCGLVKAKNSYGGYTGFRPFMAALFEGMLVAPDAPGMTARLIGGPVSDRGKSLRVADMCYEKGYDLGAAHGLEAEP